MARTAAQVIALAEAEVGYLEKKSNSQLDSKTANAGKNNYTKYARDLDAIPGFYNGKKQGYPWCDVFFDYLLVKCFGAEVAKDIIGQPDKSYGAGCGYSAKYYKSIGRFFTKGPKPGDQIFFWNSKKTEVAHTGLVYKVDGTKVYTIEGNTSGESGVIANGGGVFKKSYKLSYGRIYGYGRPLYDEELPTEKKEEVCTVELKVLKKGAKGSEVKALQTLLIGYGFSCGSSGADGDFGSNTDKAVRAYQKAKGLSVDGYCGPKTWAKLLGID
jgi:hypothetical protein